MPDIKNIIPDLDPDSCPEATEFFRTHDTELMPAFELASALVECDKTRPMPRSLFNFIVGLYLDGVSEGNCDAMNDLGALYYDGRDCDRDYSKAVMYYEMAAQHGSGKAQENLGYCYYYGRAVPVDYEKAFHYFALGALIGQPISLYKIGDMYREGHYVKKDPIEAFRIYSRCLDIMTNETAPFAAGPVYLRIGNCFLTGEGADEDPKRALTAFQRAELFLYDMAAGGEHMYISSLQAAIAGQEKARAKLAEALPKNDGGSSLQ